MTQNLTDQEYLAAIDAEALRRDYISDGESLVAQTGSAPWLEAWQDDPTLTPEEQVSEEIIAAQQML